jgi:hypothetical protein
MVTICLQCAMKALLDGKPQQVFDETVEAHMRRAHPDPLGAKRERRWLERRLREKLKHTQEDEA